jgi:hypothetical protein
VSVAGVVARARAAAEARMLDTFDIKVSAGTSYNPTTGNDEETFTLLFATVGRVKVGGGLTARESESGGRTVVTVTRELHIPVGKPAVPVGAVAFVTSVHATSDPSLTGAHLRLSGPAPGSQTNARRLEVSEVIA